MGPVFLSYRHVKTDSDLVNEIADALKERRISYFVDRVIRPGDNWVKSIESELKRCKLFVVFLSAESIRSDMVRQEVATARAHGKRMLPVRVSYAGPLPFDLGAYLDNVQYLDWKDGDSPASVIRAIESLLMGDGLEEQLRPNAAPAICLQDKLEPAGSPFPSADPRLETGAMELDSPFYVRREIDAIVEQRVISGGHTILIKGPRQVGKTSLSSRAKALAESEGQATWYVDFQLVDRQKCAEFGLLLRYFAARLCKDLRLAISPSDTWDCDFGDKENLTNYIEEALLNGASKPILFCLDEVDQIFQYYYTNDFFGMVRGWHNRRASHPLWKNFTLLVVHSTEPALFIQDLNQSPFNIGEPFRLGDFTLNEMQWLNNQYGTPITSIDHMTRLIELIGGHPYLVRQALYAMAVKTLTFAELLRTAANDTGIFGDHLRRNLWVIRQNPVLMTELRSILRGKGAESEDSFQRLKAGGLVVGDSRRLAQMRCELYADYLKVHL